MKINIDDILEKRGKTRYWLSKQVDIGYQNLMKLCRNETTSIQFKLIEQICNVLECEPNDLFVIEKE